MFILTKDGIKYGKSIFLSDLPDHLNFEGIVSMLNERENELNLSPLGLNFDDYNLFQDWFHQKEFNAWIVTRPKIIQDLASKYPPANYLIKDGAPYDISCPGTKIKLHAYYEDGMVSVVIYPENKLPAAIEHEIRLGKRYNKSPEEMKEIHESETRVIIDPIWLEYIN